MYLCSGLVCLNDLRLPANPEQALVSSNPVSGPQISAHSDVRWLLTSKGLVISVIRVPGYISLIEMLPGRGIGSTVTASWVLSRRILPASVAFMFLDQTAAMISKCHWNSESKWDVHLKIYATTTVVAHCVQIMHSCTINKPGEQLEIERKCLRYMQILCCTYLPSPMTKRHRPYHWCQITYMYIQNYRAGINALVILLTLYIQTAWASCSLSSDSHGIRLYVLLFPTPAFR